jgi:type I restriction enzyme S subunit
MIDLVQPIEFEKSEKWEIKSIEEICNIRDNKRVPLNKKEREEKKPGNIPYYGATGVMDYINDYIFDGEYILLAEDGGPFEEYMEKPIAKKAEGKFWVNNHAHIIEVKEDCDGLIQDYVFYVLEHANVSRIVQGKGRQKLTQSQLKKLKIPVPPLEVQEEVVSLLSDVDAYIEKTSERIDLLEQQKQATLQQVFGRESNNYEGFGPETFLNIPEGESKYLSEVCDIVMGNSPPGDSYIDSNEEDSLGLLQGPSDFGKIKPNPRKYTTEYAKVSTDKDILIFIRATIGDVFYCDGEYCIGRGVAGLRNFTEEVSPEYIKVYLEFVKHSGYYERVSAGTTFDSISKSDLVDIPVYIPSKNFQNQVVELVTSIDSSIDNAERDLESMSELKQGLLQSIFSN